MSFPNATIPLNPSQINHPQSQLDALKAHLQLSPLGPRTYENTIAPDADPRYLGVSYDWMRDTKEAWKQFEWKPFEEELNKLPMFMADVPIKEGKTRKIHFVGVFNEDPSAVPLLMLHGWPGCFLEFTHLLPHLQAQSKRPLTFIIPSLPGFGYSEPASLDENITLLDAAAALDGLMVGLGFGADNGGYIVQGGDIGAYIARLLGSAFDNCKGVHLNFSNIQSPPPGIPPPELSDFEIRGQKRCKVFLEDGAAYAQLHATRPATIGFLVASSPVALLAWIGEKILTWTDTTPPLSIILPWLTLYYLTGTYPTGLYSYRDGDGKPSPYTKDVDAPERVRQGGKPEGTYITRPMGFSSFPMELIPVPKGWIEKTGDLVSFKEHDKGGHFAATEQPELLAEDVLEFIDLAWK